MSACPGASEVSVAITREGETSSACRAPALRVTLRPRSVRAGKRRVLRVRVRAREDGRLRPVRGARVATFGRGVRTDRRGRARLKVRFRRAGRYTVRATAPEYRPGRRALRVVRRAGTP